MSLEERLLQIAWDVAAAKQAASDARTREALVHVERWLDNASLTARMGEGRA